MSEPDESIIWKLIGVAITVGSGVWAALKYGWTGRKKESYEGQKIKEEVSGIRFDYYQKEIEYFRTQVTALRTENAELKINDLKQREKIIEQTERIDDLTQRIENLQIDLTSANIKASKFR